MSPVERAVTILHLSDLQFGPHHRFDEAGALGSLLERLRQDLDPLMQREGLGPDLIALTGDLTELGKKSELEQVHQFASKLAGLVGLPSRRVVMTPGNHDVNWKASEAYFNACEADETDARFPYWPKLRHYADFFARFYEGEPGIRFTEEEPWSLFEYPELGVVVAGLDSAMAESHRREDHYGFLGEKQLRDFAAKLRPYKEQGYLRIGAVHHDVMHPAANETAQQDRRDFDHILLPYLNVVLHGHTHEESLAWLDPTVPVLGIGSAAVKQELRAPEVPNEYQLVQLKRGALSYRLRAYIPDQKRWGSSPRVHRDDGSGAVEEAVAFEQAGAAFGPVVEEEAKPVSDLARAVEGYRRHVVSVERMPSMFDLIGLNEDREAAGALETLGIFVPQWVRAWSPEPLTINQKPPDPITPPAKNAVRRSLDDVVAAPSEPWIVLVGAPGSGKTMVTRWLLLELCTPRERIQQLREDLVPVRIEMRLFDASYRAATRKPYGFLEYLDEVHGEKLLPLRDEALRSVARLGRALWIFDGLDEVADEKSRRLYAEMILGLKTTYPQNRGIITSRPAGAESVWTLLTSRGCAGYELLDFDVGQIFAFLRRWHSVAFPHAPEVASRRRERLTTTFREAPGVLLLCGNPLLLTMIAHLNREDELPRHRHQLYQKIVDRMADQWDANKQLPPSPSMRRFSLEDKRAFLRRLAWYMMNEVEGGIDNVLPERLLLQFAARFCQEFYDEEPDTARHTAEQLVQHLRERNHVLAFVGGGMFGFIHRTFLEYLVAADVRARLHRRDLDPAAVGEIYRAHWREVEWNEVLTLLSGLLQDDRPEYVLTALQHVATDRAIWRDGTVLMRYLGFAIRCLAEVEHIAREPTRGFAAGITTLLEHLFVTTARLGQGPTADPAALRACGGLWPEFERMRTWVRTCEPLRLSPFTHTQAYRCVVAAGGRDRRLNVVNDALNDDVPFIIAVFVEAGLSGFWTNDEIRAILTKVATRTDGIEVIRAIHAQQPGHPELITEVVRIVNSSESEPERLRAARLLLESGQNVDSAKRVFFDLMQSNVLSRRAHGAEALAFAGVASDDVVEVLAEATLAIPYLVGRCLGALRSLATRNSSAEKAFSDVMRKIATIEDSQLLGQYALSMTYEGSEDIAGKILRERAASAGAESDLLEVAIVMARIPSTANEGFVILERLYEANPTESLAFGIVSALPHQMMMSPVLERLARRIMLHGPSPLIRASAADLLWRLSTNRTSREEAFRILGSFAHLDDQRRLNFATAAYHVDREAAENLFVDLAQHSSSDAIRRTAAHWVQRDEDLVALVASTQDPGVRLEAETSLERHRLLRSLLQIGRPRRARVLLHGRFAGTLEETPGGGSLFTYDPAYVTAPGARPLAPNLPFASPRYETATLHPFFANLLPQGVMLEQAARRLGIRVSDRFGLLLAVGADVMGAVQVLPYDEAPRP